ncbi:MAG: GNAT family N-acetyltransferase [Alphaproteobacteria bacterium]|nr:GNAT family N-acetyltransferase [Alphaproteobacteria bacterium]
MPQVNFRTSSGRLAVIDRAAAIRGVSRTEFVLRSSEAAAIEILRERPVIALDDEAWNGLRRRARRAGGARPRREGALRAPPPVGPLGPPEPRAPRHDVSRFSSGVPTLDAWLRCKARLNEAKGGARTYVACDGDRVAGFYSLAASSVERRRVSSRVGRGKPDPVPVILLGQLAVDEHYRARRLGSDLLVDAAGRCLAAAGVVGARAILVQAIDERAAAFCTKFGFRPFSAREPLMLVLRTSEIEGLLRA